MIDNNPVINLDKPKGMTSHEAVTRVKRLFSARKAGHAGTLDPIATGILLVCLNEATKITRFLSDCDKEYKARMKLGERTTTLDSEGEIVEKVEGFNIDEADIKKVLAGFRGVVQQIPPMYSAIKVAGRPLYKLARKGIEIKRPGREITIYDLEMMSFEPPFLDMRVLCSKGTYIRTLCDDIGRALGVGAHMVALERTRIGSFRIEDAAGLAELPDKKKSLFSMDEALNHMNEIILSQSDVVRAVKGMSITPPDLSGLPKDSYMRLKNPDGKLFAIGKTNGTDIRVERLLNVMMQAEEKRNS